MNYVFRLPRFPVILDTREKLIHARTRSQLESKIAKLDIQDDIKRDIIDSNADGFTFYPKIMTVSPSIGVRRWNKRQIIELFNLRRTPDQSEIRSTSLGSRNLESIVADAVELLDARSHKR